MADDDGALIIGAILGFAALAAVGYAGGVSSSPTHTSSSTSSSTSSPATHSSTETVTSLSQFPKCTYVQRLKSVHGTMYTEFPTSSGWSRNCTLGRGDAGAPVTALQRSLSLCMHESVPVDGVYGPSTARAVSHAGQVGGGSQAWYQPSAERRLTWPWYSVSTGTFTGDCS